jgi:hypothetical protein
MTRRFLTLLVAGALAAAPAASRAQTSLTISGGLSAPVSTLGDAANLGYNLAAGLGFGGTILPIGARLEVGYNSFGFKNGGGDTRIVTATANAIYNISHTADAPYLIGGLGYYNRAFTNTGFPTNDANALGVNVGGGLRFPLTGFSTYFEARFHAMLGDQQNGGTYKFIPITVGISF